MKKTLNYVLAAVTLLSTAGVLASCAKDKTDYGDGLTNVDLLGTTSAALQEQVLGDYDKAYRAAAAVTDVSKLDERYKKFAEAEYQLIYEDGIVIPWYTKSGYYATVSKTVAHQSGTATYGLTADKLKDVVVTPNAITKTQRAAIDKAFEEGKKTQTSAKPDADGWISLASHNSNPAVSGGKYTYGGVSFDVKDEYRTTYLTEVNKDKFNYLCNTWTYNSEHYTNMVDGLVENDKYGNIVGALAESYKVEEKDGKEVWTFKIKKGVKWVKNSDGSEYGEVKAQDFVTSARYVLTKENASTLSAQYMTVDGAAEFAKKDNATDADFAKVGVKAVSDYELQYTLTTPTPYFLSSLTYSPFLPVNAEFLASEGSEFGATEDHILVNGAFRITKHDDSSRIEYTKNDKYWDASHVYVKKVVKVFVPSTTTPADLRGWYESGTIDGFTVNARDTEGYKKYVTGDDGKGTVKNPVSESCNAILSVGDATYIGYFNFNRSTWEVNDKKNRKTKVEKVATAKALLNKKFRLAFLYGLKVDEYIGGLINPAEPYNYIMRGYTNRELVFLNGKDYADYVDEVYNTKQGTTGVTLTGIKAGKDPIYNASKAQQLLSEAKAELISSGALTEADFPIKVDVISDMEVEVQAIEKLEYGPLAGDESVLKIQYNVPNSDDQNTKWGSIVNNYDFSVWSGWGPDYADPNTFLHTMCIGGDMVEQLGF